MGGDSNGYKYSFRVRYKWTGNIRIPCWWQLLWDKCGKDYTKLLDEIITLGLRRYKAESKKVRSFESNILSNFAGAKGVKGVKGVK